MAPDKLYIWRTMDWTGSTWVLTEDKYAGQRVTITGWRKDEIFGKVWEGKLSGGDTTIFTAETMDREIDPKTRKPYLRSACA